MERKKVFIVLSQTGSIPCRVLKFFTHDEYNHVSISFDPELNEMFSFGRLKPNNFLCGGFVEESKDSGVFKKFSQTKVLVSTIETTEEEYLKLRSLVQSFVDEKKKFKYNYLGVFLAMFRLNYSPKCKYYCSQFVRDCLSRLNILNASTLPAIAKPVDFLKLDTSEVIYKGLIKDYHNTLAL